MRIAELLDGITAEWKLPGEKLFRVFTDNGSNMVAAFKANNNVEEDSAESDGDTNEIENNTQESQELLQDPDQEGEDDERIMQDQRLLINIHKGLTKRHRMTNALACDTPTHCN